MLHYFFSTTTFLIPIGVTNFVSGLTSIKFKDYLLGTLASYIAVILPVVVVGTSGYDSYLELSQGNMLLSITLVASTVFTSIVVFLFTFGSLKNQV